MVPSSADGPSRSIQEESPSALKSDMGCSNSMPPPKAPPPDEKSMASCRGGASSFLSGSFSGQSPQNFDPPPFRSCRRPAARAPVQIADTRSARTSPSTRLAYGSAHPHTIRPSQSSTIVLHGQEQVKRVAK